MKDLSAPHLRRSFKKHFTLIELLVVIAIIAILAAMLMPALSQARMMGQRAYCQNNQKSLGMLFSAYEGEHGRLPPSAFGIGSPDNYQSYGWHNYIINARNVTRPSSPNLWSNQAKDWKVLACPGDKNYGATWPVQSYWGNRTAMGHLKKDGTYQDETTTNVAHKTIRGMLIHAAKPISRIMLVTDFHYTIRADNPVAGYCEHNYPYTESSLSSFRRGGMGDINANHRNGANHLFADGHVEFIDKYKYTGMSYIYKYWSSCKKDE